jgi:hypothetical protein
MNINCIYRADNWVKFSKRQSEKNEEKKKKAFPWLTGQYCFLQYFLPKINLRGWAIVPCPIGYSAPDLNINMINCAEISSTFLSEQ